MSQREVVLKLLRARGSAGVSAHELVYEKGITRGAAIIFELREAGTNIETVEEGTLPDGRRRLARYILHGARAVTPPASPPPENAVGWPAQTQPLRLPCGCVRAADGKSWAERCVTHA